MKVKGVELVVVNSFNAAKVGDLETLKTLPLSESLTDTNEASCLHFAARGGSLEVLKYLIKSCNFSEFQRTRTGATAMHDAAARGNTAVVKWFFDNTKLTIDDQDGVGVTSLHLAAMYCHFLTVQWLLDEAECDSTIRTASGALPLHFAVVGDDLNCVKILVDENPRLINMQMNNGATPVYLACQYGCLAVLQYLISRNGATKIKAYDAMSCLHAAAQVGHLEIVKWLVMEEKMDPNDRDFDGATPLHYAASGGHPAVIKWLLLEGSARITLDNLGGSPMHTSAEFGECECVEALLDTGCDVTLTDNNGLTASELAIKCKQFQAADIINGDSSKQPATLSLPEHPEDSVQEVPSRKPPLHSPRLSFPPPPAYPPERESNLVSVNTAAVNTSFLDYQTRSPTPPLPPPPPFYSPPDSTPPSLGSPITPPPPISWDGPLLDDPPSGFGVDDRDGGLDSWQKLPTYSDDSSTSTYGTVEQRNAGLIRVVTAEIHWTDGQGIQSTNPYRPSSISSSRAGQILPSLSGSSEDKLPTYDRLDWTPASQTNSSGLYSVVDLYPARQGQGVNGTRPNFFQEKIDYQRSVLELNSPGVLSTSADSICSERSADTVTYIIPPASSQLRQHDIADNVPLPLEQTDKVTQEDSLKPSSVAQFRALFEKRAASKDLPFRRPFEMTDRSSESASNETAESKRSPRSSASLAVTQPLREVKQPGKSIGTANENLMKSIANGGIHAQSNGGLAGHAAAIAAVARNSTRYEETSESTVANGDHLESNGKEPESNVHNAQSYRTTQSRPVSSTSLSSQSSNPPPQSDLLTRNHNGSSSSSASPAATQRVSSNDLLADIQSAVSGTSNLTLRKTKNRGEGVSCVFQSSKSKKNGSVSPTTQPTTPALSSQAGKSPQVGNTATEGDFDPKNFLDQVEKADSAGRMIPEWRRHVLAKHMAEKAQRDFEEKRQVEDYESRFKNMPAWKRTLIERKEQHARDEEMQTKK